MSEQNTDAVPPLSLPPAGEAGKARRVGKSGKPSRPSRKGNPASTPVLDAAVRLQASRKVGDVGALSQATARKALGVSCAQMMKLEDQRLLTRVQETGLRYVWYRIAEVQRLLDLLDREPEPEPSHDGGAMD